MRQNIQKLYQARIHTFTPECLELQDGTFDFHLRHAVEGSLPSADKHYDVGVFATSKEGYGSIRQAASWRTESSQAGHTTLT